MDESAKRKRAGAQIQSPPSLMHLSYSTAGSTLPKVHNWVKSKLSVIETTT
jgi:hypothetical protein